ncbi:MAG: isoaspartyl peptidase/L-asparaginase [Melioribacteraceae bacterium]|nr:isoaspartyl peptidase/L-asparaginase [Melioribacteraceae bacterium]WKZ69294.1 MAG: isoaspartyl peptidase/L-asparaginase [Melioribacteraceae bacterium]
MKGKSTLILITLLLFSLALFSQENISQKHNYGIVIHGGAGSIVPGRYTPEEEEEYRIKLNEALDAGFKILEKNGSSLDAVEAAIKILEDSPLFNAGKGSVFTSNGLNELDASIMNGKTLEAGAVAGLRHIRNPISLARAVMEKSKHVMLISNGAEQFAIQNGFELVDSSYFFTQERWDDLQRVLENEKNGQSFLNDPESKFGTVGAAALDKHGNLAAGTSTGGMTNKKFGRVGDVPVIGAGTYANNNTCAISATGHGEYFIRLGVARDISAMMEYQNKTLQQAADEVIFEKLHELGGTGGVIAIDKEGNIVMPFNTPGMFRGFKLEGKDPVVLFFKDNQ